MLNDCRCKERLPKVPLTTIDQNPAAQFRATGYETPKYRRDDVESTYELSFGIS